MFRRCRPTPLPEVIPMNDVVLDKNIRGVYAELSINFQYGTRAGIKLAGMMTLEGY